MFNLIYSLVSTPAGSLSDRVGRRRLIIGGWLVYALIYLGFALAQSAWQVWASIRRLRVVLRHGIRHRQRPGLGPGARAPARHSLRHVQRRHRAAGFSRLADRRAALAGRGFMERLWPIGAFPLRRDAGAAGCAIDGGMVAAGAGIIERVYIEYGSPTVLLQTHHTPKSGHFHDNSQRTFFNRQTLFLLYNRITSSPDPN